MSKSQKSYTVKKVSDFLVPSRNVIYQTLSGREIPAGDGKMADFFYSVGSLPASSNTVESGGVADVAVLNGVQL
jgi:hypothetical protein